MFGRNHESFEELLTNKGSTLGKVIISPVEKFPPPDHLFVKGGTLEEIIGSGSGSFVVMFGPIYKKGAAITNSKHAKKQIQGFYLQGSFPIIGASDEHSKGLYDGVIYINKANDVQNTDPNKAPQMGIINPDYLVGSSRLKISATYINGNYKNSKGQSLSYTLPEAKANNITKNIGIGMTGLVPKEYTDKLTGLLFPKPKVGDTIPVIVYLTPEAQSNHDLTKARTFPAVVTAGINRIQVPYSATEYVDESGKKRSGVDGIYSVEVIAGLDKKFLK